MHIDQGKRLSIAVAVLNVVFAFFVSGVFAQNYPVKPIAVLHAGGPGGPGEGLFRLVSQNVMDNTGRQFVLDLRPGAGGIVATTAAKQSPADGYALFLGTFQGQVVNPAVLFNLPYDAIKDFRPIIKIATSPGLLVVPGNSPAKTVRELVAYSLTRPEGLNLGTIGAGGGSDIVVTHMVRVATGMKLTMVPYKSPAQAITDLLESRVDFIFYTLFPVQGQLQSGRLRALAFSAPQRFEGRPDIPTMAEAGYDFQFYQWYALFGPSGMPDAAVRYIQQEFDKALADPKLRQALIAQGYQPDGGSSEAFAKSMASESVRWEQAVKAAGITRMDASKGL